MKLHSLRIIILLMVSIFVCLIIFSWSWMLFKGAISYSYSSDWERVICPFILKEYKIRKYMFYDPYKVRTHTEAGRCFQYYGNNQKAIRSYMKALNFVEDPDSRSDLYNRMGESYLSFNKPQEAIDCFEKAITHFSSNNEAYFNLARAYEVLGEKSVALEKYREAIQRALKQNSLVPGTYFDLGEAYCVLGEKEKALEQVSRLKESAQDPMSNSPNYFLDLADKLLDKIREKFDDVLIESLK